jgi:hypothetical protein
VAGRAKVWRFKKGDARTRKLRGQLSFQEGSIRKRHASKRRLFEDDGHLPDRATERREERERDVFGR